MLIPVAFIRMYMGLRAGVFVKPWCIACLVKYHAKERLDLAIALGNRTGYAMLMRGIDSDKIRGI